MQAQFWARNIASGTSIEITPSRPLHLTNVSISLELRDAFGPTSLTLSVTLADRRTSPRYTVATLVAGKSNTLHVDVRLDQGIKYVLTANGPNGLSLLGYHEQTHDIGQSTPLNAHNPTLRTDLSSTNLNSNLGLRVAPAPSVVTTPLGANGASGFTWSAAPTPSRAVPSSMLTGNNQPIAQGNNPPLIASQLAAANHGNLQHGSTPGPNRAIKSLRHRPANRPPSSVPFNSLPVSSNPPPVASNPPPVSSNPPPVSSDTSPINPIPDDNGHTHASKRVKNGDGTFTNRYTATDGELNGGVGHYGVAFGANGNKRKSTSDSGVTTSGVERGSAADGGGGYSSRPVAPATYSSANMPNSSADRPRSNMPYASPRLAHQAAYPDQNQAGPSQFRLPGPILPTQKSSHSPVNGDSD
ncbi:hypothetical protein EV361DRAFT_954637 [Lentinula raphanica]|nr:hypothetical protein EV361DRAFT_954637 [Lentinula raphanica]